jgi:hypothetical protein
VLRDCWCLTKQYHFICTACSKITEEEVAQLRQRYAGNQADRTAAAAAATAAAASSSTSSAAPAAGKGGKAAAATTAADGGGGKAGKNGKAAAADGKAADGKAADGKAADGKAAGGKKEKGAGGGGKGGSKAPERPVDIGRLDLRVGLINKAWRHPDAERCAKSCCACCTC